MFDTVTYACFLALCHADCFPSSPLLPGFRIRLES